MSPEALPSAGERPLPGGAGSAPADTRPPPPPPAAAEVFGSRLGLAECYAAILAGAGVQRGLIGPREVPRLWDRHLLNCAVLSELLPPKVGVIDVGSGAGLPGIAVALARPDLNVTLLEPSQRRCTFLAMVVQRLALTGVDVVRGRAEEGSRGRYDVVLARAVAPLPRLITWCLPLVAPGGRLLAVKGASAQDEVAASAAELKAAGAGPATIRRCGEALVDPPTTVVEIVGSPGTRGSRPVRRRRQ